MFILLMEQSGIKQDFDLLGSAGLFTHESL